jgi:Flp pilus assembly protein TadG
VKRNAMKGTSTKARQNQRGAVAIEVGITVVLLFALIFLVMDLSMLLFIRSTLLEAVRDGVRTGVTADANGYTNDRIRTAVQDSALGFLNGTEGACRIQINYYNPDTGVATTTRHGGDVLVVSVNRYNYTPFGALLKSNDPLAISVSSSDVVESCGPTGCGTAANPTPLSCP